MNAIYGASNSSFTDKNGNIWCVVKGKICQYATVSGQCHLSACRDTIPDYVFINGVKYIKEKQND